MRRCMRWMIWSLMLWGRSGGMLSRQPAGMAMLRDSHASSREASADSEGTPKAAHMSFVRDAGLQQHHQGIAGHASSCLHACIWNPSAGVPRVSSGLCRLPERMANAALVGETQPLRSAK